MSMVVHGETQFGAGDDIRSRYHKTKMQSRSSPGCPKRATTRADRVREEKPEDVGVCSVKTRMRYLVFPRMSSEKPEPFGVM